MAACEHVVNRGLFAGSIDFEIIHHHVTSSALHEEDKRIGGEHSSGPEQVGVGVAGGDNQSRIGGSGCRGILGHIMSKTAGIVVIGNEILSGRTRDENAAYFLKELRALGVDVRRVSVIPDEIQVIRDEIRSASQNFDYVFSSGGVGPTHDDVTIQGVAAGFERKVCRSSELETTLRGYYQDNLTDAMLRMADVPEGASLLRGDQMWFPVIAVENVYIFPGVPEILASKFQRIKERFREDPFFTRDVFLLVEEGHVADLLHEVLAKFPDLLLGSYPTFTNPKYSVKLTLESKREDYLNSAHGFLVECLAARSIVPV